MRLESEAATGVGGATGVAGQTGTGQPAILTAFTDDFEDGSFTAPPAKWLWTVRSDGDMAQWAITTDGTKVASQSLAADETELVSGDYRWTDSAIEAKVKLMTPDARAGVCVRWKNVNNKYCTSTSSSWPTTAPAARTGRWSCVCAPTSAARRACPRSRTRI